MYQIIKSALRNIRKNPKQSLLNIFSLALGIAAVIYISTYIFHQTSFDKFHSNGDRIYRCVADIKFGDTVEKLTNSQYILARSALNDLPEIEEAVRFFYDEKVNIIIDNKDFHEDIFWYAEENVFKVFDFKLLHGNINKVLAEPNTIVLTENYSKQLFGNNNPLGEIIQVGDLKTNYRVTGVLENLPTNSHLQFKFLASLKSINVEKRNGLSHWGNFSNTFTYLLLKRNTDIVSFNKKYKAFPTKYIDAMLKNMNMSLEQFAIDGNHINHQLQALNDIHLNKTFLDQLNKYSNKEHLLVLGIIALFIIVIACFNFINISTALASLRSKEIGIKKVIGSSKNKLAVQILMETFSQSCIALILSILLLFVGLSILNQFTGLSIEYSHINNAYSIITILLIPIVITLIAGIYPAILISKYNPVASLKGNRSNWGSNSGIRNGLVAFQFIVFIVLVCSTVVVKKQISFLHSQNPGFNKENVLVVRNVQQLENKSLVFKNELLKSPDVISASYSSALPSMFDGASNIFKIPDSDEKILLSRFFVDEDFEITLNLNIVEGHFFSSEKGKESNEALINKKAAKMLGWNSIDGKVLYDFNYGKQYNIIGIIDDFKIKSFKEEVLPFILRKETQNNYLAIRIRPQSAASVIQLVEEKWGFLNKKASLEYEFLDSSFNNQYKAEVHLGKMVGLFSFISILIACFGLIGLVSFTATRKTKEIGVRKVNGAKVTEILAMLNKDFLKWIVIAFIFACPIAYYTMSKWLESFAYKTELSWWIFGLAGLSALGIALLTVSWQSWRAATRNPVEALRYE